MSDVMLPTPNVQCTDPALRPLVTAYCFGRANDMERATLEAHLQNCAACQAETERLRAAIAVLEADRSLLDALTAEQVAGAFGISSALSQPFGGHWRFALMGGATYGFTLAVLLILETAYRFDLYGRSASIIAVLVWLGMTATTMLALWLVAKMVRAEQSGSLAACVGVMVGAALLLFAALCQFLPPHPLTDATIRAYTAQGAYLKGLIWIVPVGLIYLLLPFHFVVSLQRELRLKRHGTTLALLSGEKRSVTPRGTIYPRLWLLILLLIAIGLTIVPGAANLFDNLQPSPYQNLFTLSYYLRWGLQVALSLGCVVWFSRALNELKRECLIVERVRTQNLGT